MFRRLSRKPALPNAMTVSPCLLLYKKYNCTNIVHKKYFITCYIYIYKCLQIVELSVHMDCEGCEKRIRRAISKIDGEASYILSKKLDFKRIPLLYPLWFSFLFPRRAKIVVDFQFVTLQNFLFFSFLF